MSRKRNSENRGLPARWRHVHGAYYYQVPSGLEILWDNKKTFRLGKTLSEAHAEWVKRSCQPQTGRYVRDILDRYEKQIVPGKAPKTQIENIRQLKVLRGAFGDNLLTDIRPQHIYQFLDQRTAKIAGRREIAVLSHAYTKAVEWGYIDHHPFKGEVRLEGENPRTRYVTDAEILAALTLPCVRKRGSVRAIQAYIKIKLLTGMRRGDLLRLRVGDCGPEGISVTTHKTGKPVLYQWSDELRAAVEEAKKARPVDISPFLFCTKNGQGYIDEKTGEPSGWNSMWQRFMDRVMAETDIKERFTEHDLRAKCASDADTLEHARSLLAHADSKITQRVYRRKAEVVRPLR